MANVSAELSTGDVAITPPVDPGGFDYVFYLQDLNLVEENWHKDRAFLPTTITYGITFLIGVLGNGLVVCSMLGDRKGRNVTSLFLVSLAVADLVYLLACVPLETSLKIQNYWAGGRVVCKMGAFIEMLSGTATVLNLMSVSVERYIVIVHPMRSRYYCTMGKTKKIVMAVWIAAILLACPVILVMDTNSMLYYNNVTYVASMFCAENNVKTNSERILFAWYQLIVMFIIPVIVMVFCYSLVIKVLWVSTKDLAVMTQSTKDVSLVGSGRNQSHPHPAFARQTLIAGTLKDHSSEIRETRKQVIKMLLTVIGIFFICWGPKLVLNVMKRHTLYLLHTDSAFWALLVINLLPFVQSCMNPIIYSFMSNNFRRSLRNTYSTKGHCDNTKCLKKEVRKPGGLDMEIRSIDLSSRGFFTGRY